MRALIVPGSQEVARAAEAEGLHEVFQDAGLRVAQGRLLDVPRHERGQAARTRGERLVINRNFKGRQGSPTGRTLLMSPAMVAAAAIAGAVTDVREMLR